MNNRPLAQLLDQHRDKIIEVAAKYGAWNVRVFGSVARGEETLESDIDLLVEFAGKYRLWDWIKLQNELQTILNHKMDVSILSQLRDELRPYVLKDARPLQPVNFD